jgi:hypothetical protein
VAISSLLLVAPIATEEALQLQPLLLGHRRRGRREGPGEASIYGLADGVRDYCTVASVWRDRSRTRATPRVWCANAGTPDFHVSDLLGRSSRHMEHTRETKLEAAGPLVVNAKR